MSNSRIGFDNAIVQPRIEAGYAFIHQKHETDREIFGSLYALEYLRHKATFQLDHRIWSRLSASWAVRWQQRMNNYSPYTKVDVQTADMLDLDVPALRGGKAIIVESEPDWYVKQVMEDFVVRAERIRNGGLVSAQILARLLTTLLISLSM